MTLANIERLCYTLCMRPSPESTLPSKPSRIRGTGPDDRPVPTSAWTIAPLLCHPPTLSGEAACPRLCLVRAWRAAVVAESLWDC